MPSLQRPPPPIAGAGTPDNGYDRNASVSPPAPRAEAPLPAPPPLPAATPHTAHPPPPIPAPVAMHGTASPQTPTFGDPRFEEPEQDPWDTPTGAPRPRPDADSTSLMDDGLIPVSSDEVIEMEPAYEEAPAPPPPPWTGGRAAQVSGEVDPTDEPTTIRGTPAVAERAPLPTEVPVKGLVSLGLEADSETEPGVPPLHMGLGLATGRVPPDEDEPVRFVVGLLLPDASDQFEPIHLGHHPIAHD